MTLGTAASGDVGWSCNRRGGCSESSAAREPSAPVAHSAYLHDGADRRPLLLLLIQDCHQSLSECQPPSYAILPVRYDVRCGASQYSRIVVDSHSNVTHLDGRWLAHARISLCRALFSVGDDSAMANALVPWGRFKRTESCDRRYLMLRD